MDASLYRLLADLTVLIHLGFVAFVMAGGFLVLRWRRLAWVHLPSAIWGALIELGGWICPLTPLENEWRRQAGLRGYEGSFVEQYLTPVLYPSGLTRELQIGLGLVVIALNAMIYGWMCYRGYETREH
jgi:hypothetical protein